MSYDESRKLCFWIGAGAAIGLAAGACRFLYYPSGMIDHLGGFIVTELLYSHCLYGAVVGLLAGIGLAILDRIPNSQPDVNRGRGPVRQVGHEYAKSSGRLQAKEKSENQIDPDDWRKQQVVVTSQRAKQVTMDKQ